MFGNFFRRPPGRLVRQHVFGNRYYGSIIGSAAASATAAAAAIVGDDVGELMFFISSHRCGSGLTSHRCASSAAAC